jgi:hypothetical protein
MSRRNRAPRCVAQVGLEDEAEAGAEHVAEDGRLPTTLVNLRLSPPPADPNVEDRLGRAGWLLQHFAKFVEELLRPPQITGLESFRETRVDSPQKIARFFYPALLAH